jgi:hypothetical protein
MGSNSPDILSELTISRGLSRMAVVVHQITFGQTTTSISKRTFYENKSPCYPGHRLSVCSFAEYFRMSFRRPAIRSGTDPDEGGVG